MPVSSLVVHLRPDPSASAELLMALEVRPEFHPGPRRNGRLALVLDTASEEENKRAWRWLRGHAGAQHVDVLKVLFDDDLSDDDLSDDDLSDDPGAAQPREDPRP